MEAVHLSDYEAMRILYSELSGMDIDDLACAVSESSMFDGRPVVVKGRGVESYAYLQGERRGKRGDVYAWSKTPDGE